MSTNRERSEKPIAGNGRSGVISALLVFVLVLVALVYLPALSYPFQYDDIANIVKNPGLRIQGWGPQDVTEIVNLSPPGLSHRPIGQIAFALNFRLGGLNPSAWRFFNIMIHLINVILVFLIGRILLTLLGWDLDIVPLGALVGAAVWGLHPVHTQAVTYLVQRLASMMALFYLAAFYCFLKGWVSSKRKWPWHVASACLWFLALGTKENAASFPVIILLAIYYFRGKRVFKRDRPASRITLVLSLLVLVLMAAVSAIFLAGIGLEGLYAAKGMSPWQIIITQPRVYWLYLTLILFPLPSRLSIDRDFAPSLTMVEPLSTLVLWCLLAGVMWWVFLGARKRAPVAFGALWFFITIFIENSFLPLDLVYEHRLYLPTTVPFLILGGYMMRLYKRTLRKSSNPV